MGNLPGFGGFNGMIGLPPLGIGPRRVRHAAGHVARLVWALAGLGFLMAINLLDSRTGRAIRSLPARIMAESLGISTAGFKIASVRDRRAAGLAWRVGCRPSRCGW